MFACMDRASRRGFILANPYDETTWEMRTERARAGAPVAREGGAAAEKVPRHPRIAPEAPMQCPLPVNRRARTWYGQRSAPAEPFRHARPEVPSAAVRIPVPRIAQIALQVAKAPVDRPLTAFL
jgi:hypothetical protein